MSRMRIDEDDLPGFATEEPFLYIPERIIPWRNWKLPKDILHESRKKASLAFWNNLTGEKRRIWCLRRSMRGNRSRYRQNALKGWTPERRERQRQIALRVCKERWKHE